MGFNMQNEHDDLQLQTISIKGEQLVSSEGVRDSHALKNKNASSPGQQQHLEEPAMHAKKSGKTS